MQTFKQKKALVERAWRVGEEVRLQYGERGTVAGHDATGRVIVDFGGGVKRPYLSSQLQAKTPAGY